MHNSRPIHFFWRLLMIGTLVAAGAAVVMLLWNGVVTAVCGFTAVDYFQALGLLTLGLTFSGALVMLLGLLFHGLGHRHDSRRELFQKWHSMSEEQRREFLSSRGFNVEDKR